ncbi:hypothetical protein P0Y43_23215 [Pseudomonas entomophila]|nr:hypothetical protein [Pseudomonas entomophila]MDF0733602.1 hypothetical protein [Pseudomonas entomophila]
MPTSAWNNRAQAHPRGQAGNVKADVIADKDATFRPGNFCSLIRQSCWPS